MDVFKGERCGLPTGAFDDRKIRSFFETKKTYCSRSVRRYYSSEQSKNSLFARVYKVPNKV